jgi:hypothetical protein
MRSWLAVVLLAVAMPAAWSQIPDPNKPPAPAAKAATCDECGVVTSIRTVTKRDQPVPQTQIKPSGLVATIPLGGGGSPQVGSSTKIGRDAPTVTQSWEVVVRLDDGRYRIVVLDAQPDIAKGDRVKVEEGRLVPP